MKNSWLVTQRQNLICICGNRCKFWKLFQYLIQFVFNQLKMRAWFLTHQWSQRVMKEPSLLFCSLHRVSVLKWLLTFSVSIRCFSPCAEQIHEWQTEFRASLPCLSPLSSLASTAECDPSTGGIAQVSWWGRGSWDTSVLWSCSGSPLTITASSWPSCSPARCAAHLSTLLCSKQTQAQTAPRCSAAPAMPSLGTSGSTWVPLLGGWGEEFGMGRLRKGGKWWNDEGLFFLWHGNVTAASSESCCPSLPWCRHSIAPLLHGVCLISFRKISKLLIPSWISVKNSYL